ncbi:uncharacterized protein UV8b_07135 [Ustilaginoidea virens]|uniref:Uncharacterized protein n=1 Tax=Ustilaginoidea virens TaxID=1159556 RepID=A0A8E5HWH2_USTVR|nr:uncharacterized protein UV8b_07135 [Ustilaginoidea virens]QUC22894.1 hypothetical protein UV8b_07135 [Ustilaginoidea virens]
MESEKGHFENRKLYSEFLTRTIRYVRVAAKWQLLAEIAAMRYSHRVVKDPRRRVKAQYA